MVVGAPYIHFKINNEPLEPEIDYTYTWATTVETDKGPVNKPVLISSASQAESIFGVDMRPFFMQGASSLIMVRVPARYGGVSPSKGSLALKTASQILIYRAEQATMKDASGKTHKLYYIKSDNNGTITKVPVIQKIEDNKAIPGAYVEVEIVSTTSSSSSTEGEGEGTGTSTTPTESEPIIQVKANSEVYTEYQINAYLTPVQYAIDANTSLINISSAYEGDYGITISVQPSDTYEDAYLIVLSDPALGSIRINNGYDVRKIVNRINEKGFNFEAKATNEGLMIAEAMNNDAKSITVETITGFPDLIANEFIKNGIIALNANGNGYSTDPTTASAYSINLAPLSKAQLVGASNGAWNDEEGRVVAEARYESHKEALNILRRFRIAGIFCMYGDFNTQKAYKDHGHDPDEPEKGMNNNETCKWRTILLGADKDNDERSTKSSLAEKAAACNDEYTLLLGQGLIDKGMRGDAYTMSSSEARRYGVIDEHQLFPYECTQYIAGLRAKLKYYESIFGGQGRKRIRGVGDLDIAPLFDGDEIYEWDPKTYTYLNENGVLTFTEDYGNITLTDGVTTCQTGYEEDEEGVMNILKHIQHRVHDICVPYIGRNINGDLEQSITMEIQSFLEEIKMTDGSIVDTDEYDAYNLQVSLGTRRDQRLGRIYIYLKITPTHHLRQVEVEMTVQ